MRIVQVKEKFGRLRIYAKPYNEAYELLLGKLEQESGKICEDCGEEGTTEGPGWLRTLCKLCKDAIKKS